MSGRLAPCGTPTAYLRHWRRGEPYDDACRDAHNAAHRIYQARARTREGTPCTSCPGVRKPWTGRASEGWCQNCTDRWDRAGRPADGPPPPTENPLALGAETRRQYWAERRAEYYQLRDLNGLTREQAADDMGITVQTAYRWDRRREAVTA